METSKHHRVQDFLPAIRPSYLTVILAFVCGILLMKNVATNDRLFALEKQMTVFTEECYALRLNARRERILSTGSSESMRSVPISAMKNTLLLYQSPLKSFPNVLYKELEGMPLTTRQRVFLLKTYAARLPYS
ncbi:hypothetical protein OS493_034500 [Desmophyllum pertusum]|uniref:Uncharacterized protein n=1 Tax=Desmophyllum pertusum TaxID=174260 RepID=A0A9W9YV81_9CNID|nr:hypothetical protein OS493_034500 [Desmophyllum pertusum]